MESHTSSLEEEIYLGDITDACSYLPDRISTLRFGNGHVAGLHYRQLLDQGYRRNGVYVYRPACRLCRECRVLRVPLDSFQMSKEQRRVWRRGQQVFTVQIAAPSYTPEKAALYTRYLHSQHGNQREPVDQEHYESFLVDTCLGGRTFELQLHAEGNLAGVGILDRIGDALSTVYFYFNPDFAQYSPGTYSALAEIALAKQWNLRYYYLGYHIAACASMAYKSRFQPCEIKDPDEETWTTLSRD